MSIIIKYRLEKCILSVIGGFLTHLSLGAFYCKIIILMINYLKHKTNKILKF